MHFKSAVILYAVYFFTSVWSTGLNKDQIEVCISVYRDRNVQSELRVIPPLMVYVFGIQNPATVLNMCDENAPDYVYFKDLFVALAYHGTNDYFEVPTLMPFEVELFLKIFYRKADRFNLHGYLTRRHLSDVFENLYITGQKKAEAEALIPWSANGGGVADFMEFVLIMLEMLPEGDGLNQRQIEDFIKLYRLHQTDTGSIDPLKIKNIFIELRIATAPYEDLMLFYSNRPAAIELIELMIVTAERSRRGTLENIVHWREPVLTTKEVRSLISHFKILDTDMDGLLSGDEAENFVNEFNVINPQAPMTFNSDDTKINVAEYLWFEIQKRKPEGSMPSTDCVVS